MTQTRPDSVRLALPAEAAAITEVQRAWLGNVPALAGMLDVVSTEEMAQSWADAITRPPLANHRVLVATDGEGEIVGFTALGPSEDPDAEPTDGLVAQFCVHPAKANLGHEDRLLHAAADTLRADGFERATWWLRADDDATRAVLTESGWSPDGAHQEVGDEDERVRIKLIRLHTALV